MNEKIETLRTLYKAYMADDKYTHPSDYPGLHNAIEAIVHHKEPLNAEPGDTDAAAS